MTPEQVVAASKGNAHLDRGEATEAVHDGSGYVGAVGRYSAGKRQFRSVFYFDNADKLRHIRLETPSTGPFSCADLKADAEAVYGAPFYESSSFIKQTIWHDTKKNNRVDFVDMGSLCTLSYGPLKSENNAGL
jgi:hypothetical protein